MFLFGSLVLLGPDVHVLQRAEKRTGRKAENQQRETQHSLTPSECMTDRTPPQDSAGTTSRGVGSLGHPHSEALPIVLWCAFTARCVAGSSSECYCPQASSLRRARTGWAGDAATNAPASGSTTIHTGFTQTPPHPLAVLRVSCQAMVGRRVGGWSAMGRL